MSTFQILPVNRVGYNAVLNVYTKYKHNDTYRPAFWYRKFFSTNPPFPSDEFVEEATAMDEIDILIWANQSYTDGRCDKNNNIEECEYDGGDCCRRTCIENWYFDGPVEEEQLDVSNTTSTCTFKWGSYNYDCKTNSACSEWINGTCLPTDEWFGEVDMILEAITACTRNSTSHGNDRSSDFYCGRDPDYTFIHDPVNIRQHFPGCGLTEDLWTRYQCCTDIERNGITLENWDASTQTFSKFDPESKLLTDVQQSCFDFLQTWFQNNMNESHGQCCQCDIGWIGYRWDVATCYPACIKGRWIEPNTWEWDDGWVGDLCEEPLWPNCVNGVCFDHNYCECFYGWRGVECDLPISVPACVHGTVTAPDTCEWEIEYTGRICDIPVCANVDCGEHGICDQPDHWEWIPPWITEDLLQVEKCRDIICTEQFGPQCLTWTLTECTKCKLEYFLLDGQCEHCSHFSVHCNLCDPLGWQGCEHPFEIGLNQVCDDSGYITFASQDYDILESEGTVVITLNRIRGSTGRIETLWYTADNTGISSELDTHRQIDFEKSHGTVVFEDQQITAQFEIEIFEDFEYEIEDRQFIVILYGSYCMLEQVQSEPVYLHRISDEELETRSYAKVHIYDDLSIPDVHFSTLQFNSKTYTTYPFTINANESAVITVQSFAQEGVPHDTGGRQFVLELRHLAEIQRLDYWYLDNYKFDSPGVFQSVQVSEDLGTGVYQFPFLLKKTGRWLGHVYSAVQGAVGEIWLNPEFEGQSFILNNYKGIGQFNPDLLNYTQEISSIWKFTVVPATTRQVTISIETQDQVNAFLNEQPITIPHSMEIQAGVAYRFVIRHLHDDEDEKLGFTVTWNGDENLDELWALGAVEPVIPFFVISRDAANMSQENGIATIDGKEAPFNLISGTTYEGVYLMYDIWGNKLPIEQQLTWSFSDLNGSLTFNSATGCYFFTIAPTTALDSQLSVNGRDFQTSISPGAIKPATTIISLNWTSDLCTITVQPRDQANNNTDTYDLGRFRYFQLVSPVRTELEVTGLTAQVSREGQFQVLYGDVLVGNLDLVVIEE